MLVTNNSSELVLLRIENGMTDSSSQQFSTLDWFITYSTKHVH